MEGMVKPSSHRMSNYRGTVSENNQFSIGHYVAIGLTWLLIIVTLPFSLVFCIKVIFRLGRLHGGKPEGPGVVLVLPCIDDYHVIDLRTMSYDVPSQEMLTLDSVTVSVDAAVYFRTSDPVLNISVVNDANMSTRMLAQTTLRNVLGTRTLSEIMSDREGIALQVQQVLDEGTDPWGIKVERVEVRDIRLPRELLRVLASEAEASRGADAKVVCAKGELNASFVLKRAADELAQSPAAVQLRYLHTLTRISATQNHTIVVPVPIDLVRAVVDKFRKKKF